MPHLSVPFSSDGPILDLYVGVSQQRREALTAAQQPVPVFQRARALVDTGASGTCIDPPILKPLNLSATGVIPIHTPSTSGKPVICEQFDVALGIDHPSKPPLIIAAIPVISTDLARQGIHALVGRDVLQHCLLLYDGATGTFTLAF